MNINRINSNQSFCDKEEYVRQFGGRLIDGTTAHVRINLNKGGNPYSMECYVSDKFGGLSDGSAIMRTPKLKLVEVTTFLNNIRKVTDVWEVFEKFAQCMSR